MSGPLSLFTNHFLLLFLLVAASQRAFSLVHFFSPEELRYTFGVQHLRDVPDHEELWPEWRVGEDGELQLRVRVAGRNYSLQLQPTGRNLLHPHAAVISRPSPSTNHSDLSIGMLPEAVDCHYQLVSPKLLVSVSTCDARIKGTLIDERGVYVIHPFPDNHAGRAKIESGSPAPSGGAHALYKRSTPTAPEDFCGIDNTITEDQLSEDENAIFEDVFVVGQRLVEQSDLIVELAVFVDEQLWRHFSSKYGGAAPQKLQQYALTLLNNIQIMYYQPTASPPLTFRVIRYEVLKSQPAAMAPHLHSYGHAQLYLDRFCRYQRNLGVRDWDHALLLTGYDIHRGAGSTSISGIARLDGMCDPWNTCTLAEGLDFTSAFIATHELGHSVGMRHDEPYCESKHIMSSSLGPGKVTWSTCSLRDYHQFLQRLDARGKNCMRVSNLPEMLHIPVESKPGQIYDANMQCALMHGPSYFQVTPRSNTYDGICYMMWCGLTTFGRIITSHPALEGTFCGDGKWCQLGRCITWTENNNNWAPTPPPPLREDGGWSEWPNPSCSSCSCPPISGGVGLHVQSRTCTNPAPANGGSDCVGSTARALLCFHQCSGQWQSVDQFISSKCAEHKRFKNDNELTGTGSQLTRYPQRACKVFCDVSTYRGTQRNYRFYGDNLPDGTPCGYDRYCLQGDCLALSCNENALIGRDQACPSSFCPHSSPSSTEPPEPPSEWTTWSLWSACSVSCGGGYRRRSRSCSGTGPCSGEDNESETCSTNACPPPPNQPPSWSDWTEWNQCSVSCGRGSQARYRRCRTSAGTLSFACSEKNIEVRGCDEGPCNVVGIWGEWGAWSTCSTSCGPGIMLRQRMCHREPCDGSATERRSCNPATCQEEEGRWTAWNEWSACSRACGRGLRSRSRGCYAGSCSGGSAEQEYCNSQPCEESSQWATWSVWSSCSVSCGAGVKRRTRYCRYGDCPGNYKESAICNDGDCMDRNAAWGGERGMGGAGAAQAGQWRPSPRSSWIPPRNSMPSQSSPTAWLAPSSSSASSEFSTTIRSVVMRDPQTVRMHVAVSRTRSASSPNLPRRRLRHRSASPEASNSPRVQNLLQNHKQQTNQSIKTIQSNVQGTTTNAQAGATGRRVPRLAGRASERESASAMEVDPAGARSTSESTAM